MNEYSILQPGLQTRIKSRSMGVKLIVVCGLALFMTIPSFFVEGLVDDRMDRAREVVRQISGVSSSMDTRLLRRPAPCVDDNGMVPHACPIACDRP